LLLNTPAGATRGNSRTFIITNNTTVTTTFINFQGSYVRIFMIINRTDSGNINDTFKIKNFVYRSSRSAGASVLPPTEYIPDNPAT
jgi:hypothetical protein